MPADLVTQSPTVRLEGGYVFVTLTSGEETREYVLTREEARGFSFDIERALSEVHNSVTPLARL